jgi:nucleoside-diphosphate-sugar epimerase
MSNKVLITGATGYIGSKLVRKLVDKGYHVRAMTIENDPLITNLDGINCEKIIGDITKPETLNKAVKEIKTVFHLAAVLVANDKKLFHKINFEGTKNIIDASVNAQVEHFILISAAAAAYKERTSYGESKLNTEALAKRKDKTHFTIIRPTLLYGSGGSQELKIYIEKIRKFPLIIPTIGLLKSRKRPVLVDDIVLGLTKLVNNKKTFGKIYNFGGGTSLTMWDYTKLIKKTFNINKPMIPIPVFICNFIAFFSEKILREPIIKKDFILGATMDADFDQQSAREDIRYNPIDVYNGYKKGFRKKEDLF